MKKPKQVRIVLDKISEYLDNKTLMYKLMLVGGVCVLLPMLAASVALVINVNNNYRKSEQAALNIVAESDMENLEAAFEEAIVIGNMINTDSLIKEVAEREFESYSDYYVYITEHNLQSYLDTYLLQKSTILDVNIYLDNSTILGGDKISPITDEVKKKSWYQKASTTDRNIDLCVDKNAVQTNANYNITDDKEVFTIVRKLSLGVNQGFYGYAVIVLDMHSIKKIMKKDNVYISTYLVNEAEDIVYSPKDSEFLTDIEELSDKSVTRFTTSVDFDGVNYLENWKIVGVYDYTDYFTNQAKNVVIILLVMMFSTILLWSVMYLIFYSFNSRMVKLKNAINEAEPNNFKTLDVKPAQDELGLLIESYNDMAVRINSLVNEVYTLELKNKDIEVERVKAELRALQQQVNPHFIFNVLNAMLVLSVKNQYTVLTPYISGLAKMLRRLVDWKEGCEPLSTEISFIEIYMQFEKLRFGDMLNYSISVDEAAGECSLPRMIIQPLVENACRHGLQGLTTQRVLEVRATYRNEILTISVRDNGVGMSRQRLKEIIDGLENEDFDGHIGIKNVYRRLKLQFEDRLKFEISSEERKGTEFIITVDYREE